MSHEVLCHTKHAISSMSSSGSMCWLLMCLKGSSAASLCFKTSLNRQQALQGVTDDLEITTAVSYRAKTLIISVIGPFITFDLILDRVKCK